MNGSKDGTEQFFSYDDERCDGTDGLLRNSVSVGVREFADQAFATELPDVVGGATNVIVGIRHPGCGANSVRQVPGSKSIRATSQREHGTEYGSGSGLVEVDAADSGLADLRGSRKLIERFIADEGGIHVVQVAEELLEDLSESEDDVRETVQESAAAQLLGVVSNGLETKYVFAFGVCLQSQLAEV